MNSLKINKLGYSLFINFKDERLKLHELNEDLALALELTIKKINKERRRQTKTAE